MRIGAQIRMNLANRHKSSRVIFLAVDLCRQRLQLE
jgi:hypothetical protein